MGLLRFCLALAVVATHTRQLFPFRLIPGFFAVKVFFVISGFYMALILNEKYLLKSNSYSLFITNRILRLYPLYLIVFIFSFIMYMLCVKFPSCSMEHYTIAQFNPYTYLLHNTKEILNNGRVLIYNLFSNLFILGLDWPYFINLPHVEFVPQAWTVSLEFYFYFLAPFLVRQKLIYLIFLSVFSVFIRKLLAHLGFVYDPWPFRFFPSEFVFFLLGILSYRIYTKLQSFKISKYVFVFSLFLIIGPILSWHTFMTNPLLPIFMGDPDLNFCLYFLVLVIGLPIIFLFTKNNSFDRWIGEFSYPIYIIHFAVLYFTIHIFHTSSADVTYGWQVAALSFILTFFILNILIYPIEKIRSHRILDHKM